MHPKTASVLTGAPVRASHRRSWQRGGAVLAVMAGLLVMAASTLAIRMARQVEDKTAQQQLTSQRMQRIAQALQGYWLVHGCTLPDGAAGNAGTGDAAVGGTTVPWRTLGIAQEDSFDAWGRKLSYKTNTQVRAFEAVAEPAGWVLVSHGPTGLGAWLPSGQQMPAPGNADELTNANLSSPLQLKQENAGTHVQPANLFDDFLVWGTLDSADCASSPPSTGDIVKKLLEDPDAIDTKGNGSGRTAIDLVTTDLGTVRISSTGGEISTDGPYKALGVCSSGCGKGNDSNRALDSSESLSIRLGTGKTAKGLTLGLLGWSGGPTTASVSITFIKHKPPPEPPEVVSNVILTNISINTPIIVAPSPAGTTFDEVVVQPVGASRFYIATVIFCQTATCT